MMKQFRGIESPLRMSYPLRRNMIFLEKSLFSMSIDSLYNLGKTAMTKLLPTGVWKRPRVFNSEKRHYPKCVYAQESNPCIPLEYNQG